MASSGGTPDFMVDDESFEASAKKPLVEALVDRGVQQLVWGLYRAFTGFHVGIEWDLVIRISSTFMGLSGI